MNTVKKLAIFLGAYAVIMTVLWNRLTENTQVKEVLLLLFAVSIIIFTLIYDLHKINIDVEAEQGENARSRNKNK